MDVARLNPTEYSSIKPGSAEPEVGIFWTYNGSLFHIESEPLSKAVHTSVSIDYSKGHYAIWYIMAHRGVLNTLPPDKRDEYDSISRGRVVYLFSQKNFVIYHGDEFNPKIRDDIMRHLHLPPKNTVEMIDQHYNPLPEDYVF